METQTRYDLNATIGDWRLELSAQVNLTAEVRRELETHLRDAVVGFQQRGLNDEESFWLARRRVGQPQQLGEEFVKANPAAIWRERVFWMVLATLILTLWGQSVTMFVAITVNSLANNTSVGTRLFCDNCFRLIFNWLPILVCALLLAKGRLGCNYPRFLHFFRSRFRLCTAAILWVLINCGMNVCGRWQSLNPLISGSANSRITYIVWANFWSSLLYMTIWPFLLVTLLVWLMPAQYHKFSKLA